MKAEESGIAFDFTAAGSVVRHDKEPSADAWPGVDFRVDEGARELWIEVKSWHPSRFKTQAERLEKNKEFLRNLTSEAFRDRLVHKFIGTTAYLAWTGAFKRKPVRYVVLLDSSWTDRRALLGPFEIQLRKRFRRSDPWGGR